MKKFLKVMLSATIAAALVLTGCSSSGTEGKG